MFKKIAGLVSAVALVAAVACSQTDAGVTTAIKAKFAADDTVKAYQIDVDTRDHVVTLSGDVETSAAKEHAVMIARQTDGVRDVVDNLRVNAAAATSGRLDGNDVDVDIDNDLERDADRAGAATKEAGRDVAGATRNAADKAEDVLDSAAEKTVDAARKTGRAVRDAVTDNDRDSDNDGK